jgi:thiol-disulfide isomerase/thioredoxin
MKKYIIVLLLPIVTGIAGKTQGIRFETGSWADVKAKAKAANKPIFVDAYTTWCGPCKAMAKNVFPTKGAGDYFNSHYINYQLDMEKGEGIEFAKQYEVNAFPTLLYFDAAGNLAFKAVGAKDEAGLLSQAKLAMNPDYQLATYKKEYEDSGKTLTGLKQYVNKLREGGSYNTASGMVADYITNMPEKDRFSTDAWQLIRSCIGDYKSPVFEFVLQNKKQYEKLSGKQDVNQYVFNVLASRSVPGSRGADSREIYYGALEKYRKYVPVDYFIARMLYFEHLTGNEDSCYTYAKNLLDKKYEMVQEDDKLAYYRIYMANRYVNEEGEKMSSALRWAQEAVAVNAHDYKPAFVLAQLLYKQGKYKEALKWAETAQAGLASKPDAPVMQKLFKADTIQPFIEKVKAQL